MTRRLLVPLLLMLVWPCQRAMAACQSTIATVNFGTYTGSLINTTAAGSVNCTPDNSPWYMPLSPGNGPGATVTNRLMTGPNGTTLKYALFRDSARTMNWGNTENVDTLTGTGDGNVTIYAQLAANQNAISGTYTDTISSATTSFTITVTVANTCTIGATALSFPNYTGAVLNAQSTITVKCTNLALYYVGLNAGTTTGATVTSRKMKSGTHTLNYALYSNSTRTTNWGNTVGTDTVNGAGTGVNQGLTVYGQVPAGQTLFPGSYTDIITATITY
jgi:spore coat protein U-like protein